MATLEKIRSKGVLLLIVVGAALLIFIIGDFVNSGSTYFNQMKLYVLSITDTNNIDKVNKIKYGDELTGEYLVKYNEIIEQSNKVMQKLISLNTERETV